MFNEACAKIEFLTAADVGRIVGVTPASVRALTIRGRLTPVALTVSGIHLYSRETAERYAAERAARLAERAGRS